MLADAKAMLRSMDNLLSGLDERPLSPDVLQEVATQVQECKVKFASERRPVKAALAMHRWAEAVMELNGMLAGGAVETTAPTNAAAPAVETTAPTNSAAPAASSEMRAVSVAHLSNVLAASITNAGLSTNDVVYEVEPVVIRPPGENVVCPRDGERGAAYVDCFGDPDDVGPATVMLSYTWGYKVCDIIETLLQHCARRGLDGSRTYVWMCCLCVNQHRVRQHAAEGKTVPFETFKGEFKRRVEGIGHVVAMMAPWRAPIYISRVWCDFELYTATSNPGVEVTIEMPPSEATDFLDCLQQGDSITEVWKVLNDLRVEQANASVKHDREMILQLIQEGPGFHCFNSIVAILLQDWVASIATQHMNSLLSADSPSERGVTNAATHVTDVLVKGGKVREAVTLLERTLDYVGAKQGDDAHPDNHCHLSVLWGRLAAARRQLGETDLAEAALWRSRVLWKGDSDHTRVDLAADGLIKLERGDSAGARANFERSLELARASGELEAQQHALINLGNALAKEGELPDAVKAYVEAYRILTERGMLQTPEAACLSTNLANVHRLQADWPSALRAYEDAKRVYEKMGIMRSPNGANLLLNLSIASGQSGDVSQALEYVNEAMAIYEENSMLDTPNAQQARQVIQMCQGGQAAP